MQWQPLSASLTSSQVSITQRKPRKRIQYFFNNCYISNDALHVYFYALLKIHIDFIIIFTFVKYHHLYKRKFFYNHFVLYIQWKASIHSERSTCRRVRNKTENWAKAVEGNTSYKSYMKYCSVQFVMYPSFYFLWLWSSWWEMPSCLEMWIIPSITLSTSLKGRKKLRRL